MSVTAMIRDPKSSLRRFLDARLPHRAQLVGGWLDTLRTAPMGSSTVKADASQLGQAVEIRIGLDLAEHPGPWGVLQALRPAECERLLTAAGYVCGQSDIETYTTDPLLRAWARASHPVMADTDEQRFALAACYAATWIDKIDHWMGDGHPVESRRWLLQLHRGTDDLGELAGVSTESVEDLRDIWRGYIRFGRAQLINLGQRVIVSPVLVPGFAVPDLIVGRAVVDIKTYLEPAKHLDLWLDQVLSYALLDRWDVLGVNEVAVYLGWQAVLMRAGFGALLSTDGVRSGESMSALRHDLHEAIKEDLDDAALRQLDKRFPRIP